MSENQDPQLANLCLITDREGNINETYAFHTNTPAESQEIVDGMRPVRAGQCRTVLTNFLPVQVNAATIGRTHVFDMAKSNFKAQVNPSNVKIVSMVEVLCQCEQHVFRFKEDQTSYKTKCPNCLCTMEATPIKAGGWNISYIESDREKAILLVKMDDKLTLRSIYFLVENDYLYHKDKDSVENTLDNVYYVNESTCPTNILGGMDTTICAPDLVHGDLTWLPEYYDCDPHGFLRIVNLVSIRELKEKIGKDNWNWNNLQSHENHAIMLYMLETAPVIPESEED